MDDREVGPASRSGATVGDGDSQIFASRPLFWRRMLLTMLKAAHRPATDLGFLLHKHPDHVHTRGVPLREDSFVLYPEATEGACTAAILLDVDPVGHGPRPRRQRRHHEDQLRQRSPVAYRIVSALGRALTSRSTLPWVEGASSRPDLVRCDGTATRSPARSSPIPGAARIPPARSSSRSAMTSRSPAVTNWTRACPALGPESTG